MGHGCCLCCIVRMPNMQAFMRRCAPAPREAMTPAEAGAPPAVRAPQEAGPSHGYVIQPPATAPMATVPWLAAAAPSTAAAPLTAAAPPADAVPAEVAEAALAHPATVAAPEE